MRITIRVDQHLVAEAKQHAARTDLAFFRREKPGQGAPAGPVNNESATWTPPRRTFHCSPALASLEMHRRAS